METLSLTQKGEYESHLAQAYWVVVYIYKKMSQMNWQNADDIVTCLVSYCLIIRYSQKQNGCFRIKVI